MDLGTRSRQRRGRARTRAWEASVGCAPETVARSWGSFLPVDARDAAEGAIELCPATYVFRPNFLIIELERAQAALRIDHGHKGVLRRAEACPRRLDALLGNRQKSRLEQPQHVLGFLEL